MIADIPTERGRSRETTHNINQIKGVGSYVPSVTNISSRGRVRLFAAAAVAASVPHKRG